MPTYAWTCHACHASNLPEAEQCAQCGCPAQASAEEIEAFVSGAKNPKEIQNEKPVSPAMSMVFVLFGLVLLIGAVYQVVRGEWFPLFPIQIDGIFSIFSAYSLNAGIYASSLLATILGLGSLLQGLAGLRRRNGYLQRYSHVMPHPSTR